MSSMVRNVLLLTAASVALVTPALAQDAAQWDRNRQELIASGPGRMAGQIRRWETLSEDRQAQLPFAEYASFLVANPGFPDETRLRAQAEQRLRREFVSNDTLLTYFDKFPPVTNFSRAHYALALMGRDRNAAQVQALAAWRGGEMSEVAEAMIGSNFSAQIGPADQDARMNALLWQREREAAERQLPRTSPEARGLFVTRLSILQGGDGATSIAGATSDPGYLYNRSRELRQEGRSGEAAALAASRPALAHLPFDQTDWITEQLAVARSASARDSARIAARADEAFEPGADISKKPYKLRDDYTSLMWLGGTNALWQLGDGTTAAPLFYRYGAAAQTPQTRSKGFFWAGEAMRRAGNGAEANRYFEMAAAYPDRFYGLLALQRLGRSLPSFKGMPDAQVSAEARAAFNAQPLTQAVAEVARDAPWSTGIRFYRAIANQAESIEDHLLVAELAQQIGRRDLAVNLADAAQAKGYDGFTSIGYPTLQTPRGTNWTMVHAIARQESQFAANAISHAGARGLMQLMPGTAREEADKAGITYMSASLTDDPAYNVRLGSNHIERLISYYGGSYPLAIAAYNAGPGNVNRWLRENGDPRTGSIDWLQWIEKIGFFETKNYVQRVIENAVVYEALHPELASQGRPRTVDQFLR